jgi:hypothetical protein
MSKMSDGELCTHFSTELQKKGSSICLNRQCNCLAIFHNGNARLLTRDININHPECASDKVAEEKEQMMLEAAEHVKMARA